MDHQPESQVRDRALSRRNVFKTSGAAALAAAAGPLIAACAANSSSPANANSPGMALLDHMRSVGFGTVVIANEPPYTKLNPDGSVTGAEPDVARAILKLLGVPNLHGIVAQYDGMIPGLLANRWDMIAAGLFMKKSRCAQVAYAHPDLISTESFAVAPGNPDHLRNYGDVKANSKVTLGVLSGAYEYGLATAAGIPGSRIVQFTDSRSGLDALHAGRIQAYGLPTLSLQGLLKTQPGFEVTPQASDVQPTGSGIAFRKNDTALVDLFNQKFEVLAGNGQLQGILGKWGFSAAEAQKYHASQLCNSPG